MKETDYYKSGKHLENVLSARDKACASSKKKRNDRIILYSQNPSFCVNCNHTMKYEKKNNKFCCKSCAAQFNNKIRIESGWVRTEESKKKTSKSVKLAYSLLSEEEKEIRRLSQPSQKHSDVEYTCPVCNKTKLISYRSRNRKTCGSDDCKVYASVGVRKYKNGRRKITWFFNPNENKEVLLESSWEVDVANLLIERNIEWIRPTFIKWVDNQGVTRRYFPDFYLLEYDLYLDPKNPWGMLNSKEKMDKISKQVNIIYGDLQLIKTYINNL